MGIILLDCDDVLADFATPALGLVAVLGGPALTPEKRFQWEIGELLNDLPAAKEQFWSTLSEPGWCSQLEPYADASHAVQELQKLGEVVVVTSPLKRSRTWMHERTDWLKKHFGIEHSHVVNSSNKRWIHGDFLADDKPDNLRDWNHGYKFCIARSYNTFAPFARGSLAEFVEFVATRREFP